MTTQNYDVIIIGGGHNGLVCAAYLGKAGLNTLVLEASDQLGGMAASQKMDGVSVPALAHLLWGLDQSLARDLGLDIDISARDIATISLQDDGQHLKFSDDQIEGINGAEISKEDLAGYISVSKDLNKFADLLAPLMTVKPPRLKNLDRTDSWNLIKFAMKMRLLGKKDMQEFLRVVLLNIADMVEDNINDKRINGFMAMEACWGTHLAPRSPGSVLSAMYKRTGKMTGRHGGLCYPKGGMAAVMAKLAEICQHHNVDIRTNAKVDKVLIDNDKAIGVQLISGEEIRATTVASNADPRQTFLGLVGSQHLDINFTRRINNIRDKGDAAKVNLILNQLPSFKGLSDLELGNRLVVCPNIHYAELAFNPCKYGEMSNAPALEIVFPSLLDQDGVSGDTHVMSITAQYMPFDLEESWGDETRAKLFEIVVSTIEKYAPDIRSYIICSETLSPADIAEKYNNSSGHWHHVEMQVDQLLMNRPTHGIAQYETCIEGLYLCGAGAHPGGNVTGVAGKNAAAQILKSFGK